jgi:adenine-specific DNA-methyltransferase
MRETVPQSLTSGLISYIGNKRRILPQLASELSPLLRRRGSTSFLDPFCGSGAVSRLARYLGCAVWANDWEPYAQTVTGAYLENSPADLERLFAPFGGRRVLYDRLNSCREPSRPYISLHYAPRETEHPRIGEERLFYTAENARFIDAVRDEIDRLIAPDTTNTDAARVRRMLLASLVHQASVHANTSGVFKAYHRGFGGLGRDSLSRILRPMALSPPVLQDGPPGVASRMDAYELVGGRSADICYLDPPYASHQYGSNYFMLNTIVLWDRPPVDDSRDSQGRLLSKAGIRPDWTCTRSAFCSRRAAATAIGDLVNRIDARYLVVSYSSDGIVPLEELAEILSGYGELRVRAIDYTTYRGGKQSISRNTSNAEFVFVAERRGTPRPAQRVVPEHVARCIASARIRALASRRFHPQRIESSFDCRNGSVVLAEGWEGASEDRYRLTIPHPPPDLSAEVLERVRTELAAAACVDHFEELEVVLSLARAYPECRHYLQRASACVHKFAHRKYREQFERAVAMVKRAISDEPEAFETLASAVAEVESRARLRYGAE